MTSASHTEPALRWLCRATAGIPAGGARGFAKPAASPASPHPAHGPELLRTDLSQPRLGVLSGTFNPPTCAHLTLGECAAKLLSLDEVLCVLPEIPPHKEQLEASLQERAEMLVRAIAANPKFSAAIVTHGLFLDICRAAKPHYPAGTLLFFLTGRDAAERVLLNWPYDDPPRALAEMFACSQFVVASRNGRFVVPAGSLAARYAEKIHCLDLPPGLESQSATLVRQRLARHQGVEGLVPREVASYILERGLYQAVTSDE